MYSCNLCKEAGKEFKVPADPIGAAIMRQHLKEEHNNDSNALGN